MCSDRGVAPELRAGRGRGGVVRDCAQLHVSGYALLRGADPLRARAARSSTPRAVGAPVSVDLSSWSAIRDFGPERFRALLEEIAPDVVFANEDEDEILGGAIAGSRWIVKRGPAGASFDGDEREAEPVAAVVDSTGAGDAFAAGWLVGGPDLALAAAARCVQQAGSMP